MGSQPGKGFNSPSHPFGLVRKKKNQRPSDTAEESRGQLCTSKASEPETGFRFHKLPAELRYLCWDWAARLEAADMIIFVRPDHVIYPTKKLLSPLLSVNRESRSCALKVYNLSLEIHEGEGWQQVQRREWEAQQRNKSASTNATTLDDISVRPTEVDRPLIRVNLELSTMICQYWIRHYTRRPSNQSLSELEKAKFFPTSPGPWRLGPTPVSSMLSLSERSKVGGKVLVKLHDSPGPRWQSFVKSHHPEGPAEVSRWFYPGVETLFFLTLGLQNGPTTVLYDLNDMGWKQFRQKMGSRITEWTSDEESDKEKQGADNDKEKKQDADQEEETSVNKNE